MIPKRWIEAYLRFLLRNRLAVSVVVALMTVFFAGELRYIKVVPQFLDFYPGPSHVRLFGHEYTWRKGHPYINIYNTFRRMFGSANILTVILETKHGDVYNPTTLQKLDTITKRIVETKGVVPYQVLSIAHPKMKSTTPTASSSRSIPRRASGVSTSRRTTRPSSCTRDSGRRSSTSATSTTA